MALLDSLLSAFGDIFRSPFVEFGVLWLLIPLLLLWITLEIYFDVYRDEKLGWNTALGNGITLFWISADVMRAVFAAEPAEFWLRFSINVVVMLYAFLIIYLSFGHKISEKWDFVLASPTPIYYIAAITILWGYGSLPFNRFVAIDLVILFVIVLVLKQILRRFIPKKEGGGEGLGGEALGPELGGALGGPGAAGGELPPMPKM